MRGLSSCRGCPHAGVILMPGCPHAGVALMQELPSCGGCPRTGVALVQGLLSYGFVLIRNSKYTIGSIDCWIMDMHLF